MSKTAPKFYAQDFCVIKGYGIMLTGELEIPLNGYELDKLKEVEVDVRGVSTIVQVSGVDRFALSKDSTQKNIGILLK